LGVLFLVALLGIVVAGVGVVWSTAQQREHERDLLFVGNAFRWAIANYYDRTPGTVKRYPDSLKDLLKDGRQLGLQRYLRQVYADPMTGKAEWGTVKAPDGGIMGIYSLSKDQPMKSGGFRERDKTFEGARSYADWQFVYVPKKPANQ